MRLGSYFTDDSDLTRAAFFAVLLRLAWDGAVLSVDERRLPKEFARLREPHFTVSCWGTCWLVPHSSG